MRKLVEILDQLQIPTENVFEESEDNEFFSIVQAVNNNIYGQSSPEITSNVFRLLHAHGMMKMGAKMKKLVDLYQQWKYKIEGGCRKPRPFSLWYTFKE